MFASQFIHAAFQRFAEPKIIAMQGEHFLAQHGVEDPIRKFDFEQGHAVGIAFGDDFPIIDQPEAFTCAFVIGLNIGLDACAA